MQKLERFLKIISFSLGTIVFGFLCWLMLIYQNFEEPTAYILGFVLIAVVLTGSYYFGHYFIDT